jgi:hypothetical protein
LVTQKKFVLQADREVVSSGKSTSGPPRIERVCAAFSVVLSTGAHSPQKRGSMNMQRMARLIMVKLLLTTLGLIAMPVAAQQITVDAKTIERLENLINTQQKQLEVLQQEVN